MYFCKQLCTPSPNIASKCQATFQSTQVLNYRFICSPSIAYHALFLIYRCNNPMESSEKDSIKSKPYGQKLNFNDYNGTKAKGNHNDNVDIVHEEINGNNVPQRNIYKEYIPETCPQMVQEVRSEIICSVTKCSNQNDGEEVKSEDKNFIDHNSNEAKENHHVLIHATHEGHVFSYCFQNQDPRYVTIENKIISNSLIIFKAEQ